MSNYKVELIPESVMNFIGKNFYYCKETNFVYWCDVLGGQVFKMDLNNHYKIYMFKILGEKTISFCVPIYGKKDQFLVGAGTRLLHVTWDGIHTMGQIVKVLTEVPVTGVRLHSYAVDNQGRLFFATMIDEEYGNIFDMDKHIGGLYRYTMHDGLVQMKNKVGLGNGIVFNNTFTKMYFVDSYELSVFEFDYDFKTGNIANQKVFFDVTSYGKVKKVVPGDLTIDHEDNVYLTMFGAGKIMKINSKTHKMDCEYKLTVQQPTAVQFVGKNMDTLFVASCGMEMHEPQVYPAGYLTKITNVGAHGVEMHKFVMN
jgi:sugar lactone lactonase YvrE